MPRTLNDVLQTLPTERRERIERQAQELKREYDLLSALRRDRDLTQEELAKVMDVRQASISKLENQDDILLSTLRRYVEALGGELDIRVRFTDEEVSLAQFGKRGA